MIRIEQLSASAMMLEGVQFTEILTRQNGLNQPGVAIFLIRFVLGTSGAYNIRCNNLHHVIDTSDSGPDLERTVNSD